MRTTEVVERSGSHVIWLCARTNMLLYSYDNKYEQCKAKNGSFLISSLDTYMQMRSS